MDKKVIVVDKTLENPNYYIVYEKDRDALVESLIKNGSISVVKLIDKYSNESLLKVLEKYKSKMQYTYIYKHKNYNKESEICFENNNFNLKLFFAAGSRNDWCVYVSINDKMIVTLSEALAFNIINDYINTLNINRSVLYTSINRNIYLAQLHSKGNISTEVLNNIKNISERYNYPGTIYFILTLIYYLMIREEHEDTNDNPFKSQSIMLLTYKIMLEQKELTCEKITELCRLQCNRISSNDEDIYEEISKECVKANIAYV